MRARSPLWSITTKTTSNGWLIHTPFLSKLKNYLKYVFKSERRSYHWIHIIIKPLSNLFYFSNWTLGSLNIASSPGGPGHQKSSCGKNSIKKLSSASETYSNGFLACENAKKDFSWAQFGWIFLKIGLIYFKPSKLPLKIEDCWLSPLNVEVHWIWQVHQRCHQDKCS